MQESLQYCKILGTNINVITMEQTVEYLDTHLEELRGDYICVSNVHTTVMAYRDSKYRAVQNGGAMALPDGKPLSIVCRKRGYKEAGRVPGPDLMPEIFRLSQEKGYRHYFYGSKESTLEALKERLLENYPKLNIVGMFSPPFRELTEKEDAEQIRMINEAKPDFIWVGLGAPKQENWMAAHKGMVTGVMLGVGAGFDFHAGTIKRAPKWMQELCLEWLFRLMQDPRRLFPRYLKTNVSFVVHTAIEGKKLKKAQKKQQKQQSRQQRPMRIAMIGHKRIPSREGGVEVVVQELATRMTRKGYQIEAYNRSGYHVSGKEYDRGHGHGKYYQNIRIITIPTFKNGKLNAIVYAFFASIRALFGRYDIIHYHAEGPCAMLWIPKMFGKRIVVTIHGLDWQRSKWGTFASNVIRFGEKMAAKHADEVIVLSKNIQEYFRENYYRETLYIPNGIVRPQKKEASVIKERWGLEKDSYILFLARLVPEKGLHYLIDAFSELDTQKRLVIAGGPSHSVEYIHQLEKKVKNDERILMTGFVEGAELEELYSNAYVFVLPSDVEGMALSLLEAMSYGNCCLVSDIPENTEVIGQAGGTFQKGKTDDLKRQLAYLLENPEIVRDYQEQSCDYICKTHDWDDIVDRTLEVYQKAVDRK